jgi:hypothetical protein
MQKVGDTRLIFYVPTRARAEHRQPFPKRHIQLNSREHRDQPHHRPRPHRERRAIALTQPIVEKAVLVVPEPAHRGCD